MEQRIHPIALPGACDVPGRADNVRLAHDLLQIPFGRLDITTRRRIPESPPRIERPLQAIHTLCVRSDYLLPQIASMRVEEAAHYVMEKVGSILIPGANASFPYNGVQAARHVRFAELPCGQQRRLVPGEPPCELRPDPGQRRLLELC